MHSLSPTPSLVCASTSQKFLRQAPAGDIPNQQTRLTGTKWRLLSGTVSTTLLANWMLQSLPVKKWALTPSSTILSSGDAPDWTHPLPPQSRPVKKPASANAWFPGLTLPPRQTLPTNSATWPSLCTTVRGPLPRLPTESYTRLLASRATSSTPIKSTRELFRAWLFRPLLSQLFSSATSELILFRSNIMFRTKICTKNLLHTCTKTWNFYARTSLNESFLFRPI